jgi:hypothetical protein
MVYSLTAILEKLINEDNSYNDNFFNAYNSISNKESSLNIIKEGIIESIKLQKILVQQVLLMIERKKIVSSGLFRIAYLNSDDRYFLSPYMLSKIAIFLKHIVNSMSKDLEKKKKLLLCSENKSTKNTFIIGLSINLEKFFFFFFLIYIVILLLLIKKVNFLLKKIKKKKGKFFIIFI